LPDAGSEEGEVNYKYKGIIYLLFVDIVADV
jgi:hypothetical protein